MFERWRVWMHARGSARMITRTMPDGTKEPYLERFHLLQLWGWALFLHQFVMSDIVDFHDHPWSWGRLILRGRYAEHVRYPSGSSDLLFPRAGLRSFARREAKTMHRVELFDNWGITDPTPVWTLFWHGPRCRQWGFMINDVWVAARESGNENRTRTVGFLFPRKLGESRG